jgi:hypothetical protein
MKRTLFALLFVSAALVANVASAYEFHLQYTAAANARNLSVVGYNFPTSNSVLGNCSYSVTSACSGRGCHSTTTWYYHTCTWDTFGNLMSVVAGAPPAQTCSGTSPTNPYELICATSGASSTGRDTRGYGFVDTPAPHYSWQTPNGTYAVIPDAPYAVAATLVSDGDIALTIGTPAVTTHVNGTITPSPGTASVTGDSCPSSLAPGNTCTVSVNYDPTAIACTASPYGYAYAGIDLAVPTSSVVTIPDFTQNYTITGVPICDD